jgi:magnesium chelatase subunit I
VSRVTAPQTATLGSLRDSGHVQRTVKAEVRDNLLLRLAAGEPTFPGILGYDETVLPEVERALLAGHDLVLLGERGQGKTRLIRTLIGLLDEWTPVVEGCEINDHPYAPVCVRCQRLVAASGDATPVAWKHRSLRYGEKLATPDTSVGDLIGDVDPIKVAEGRTLGDPETIHYGLVPRTNRGIFSINELPDLAERIQVALLNVLEERDIQVRGYTLRLPLDLLLIASANPEDYTNRGRIITPLKDRFGAEVRTHYPIDLEHELELIRQEAVLTWPGTPVVVPAHLLEIVARWTRLVRESPQVDQRSGVSARVCDLPSVVPASRGKVEFEAAEEGRELEVLAHLLRKATADTFRAQLAGSDLTGLQARFDEGGILETGDLVPASQLLADLGTVPGLAQILERLGITEESPGLAAAALEFALEGLHLNRRLAKDSVGHRTVYGR